MAAGGGDAAASAAAGQAPEPAGTLSKAVCPLEECLLSHVEKVFILLLKARRGKRGKTVNNSDKEKLAEGPEDPLQTPGDFCLGLGTLLPRPLAGGPLIGSAVRMWNFRSALSQGLC